MGLQPNRGPRDALSRWAQAGTRVPLSESGEEELRPIVGVGLENEIHVRHGFHKCPAKANAGGVRLIFNLNPSFQSFPHFP